jgi:DNA-binding transcriptional regulator YdaS (Cro superfamily)
MDNMSKLKEYLFYKQKSVTDFAKEMMVSRSYMNRVVLGKVKPSRLLAKEIERMTNGEVKAEDLLKGE